MMPEHSIKGIIVLYSFECITFEFNFKLLGFLGFYCV